VLLALIACSVITIFFGIFVSKEPADYIEGGAIMAAVVIVSGVGSVNNWLQEGQFASLTAVKADRSVQVVRDGHEQTVSVFDVVVGDLFVIKAGELLPCDGLLLRGSGLKCDESAMTGESLEVPKSVGGEGHSGPFLMAGAQVTAGAGTMIVLTVGTHTSFGKIISSLEDTEPPPTPLQEKLEAM
jgi:Ca2+-transporting ATPase